MPGLTTNDEYGSWKKSRKILVGFPSDAEKVQYQSEFAKEYGIKYYSDLDHLLEEAVRLIGPGSTRKGTETQIPLQIWRTRSFQGWYENLKAAGNVLEKIRVEYVWPFGQGIKGKEGQAKYRIFFWSLHATVFITKENRRKENEFVTGRPDLASALLYKKGKTLGQTEIVLISEFRTPVSNKKGLVFELPAGSCLDAEPNVPLEDNYFKIEHEKTPQEAVLKEIKEETGVDLTDHQNHLRHSEMKTRQMMSTLCTVQNTLFSMELNENQLNQFKHQQGKAFGVVGDTEKTYVHVVPVSQLGSAEYPLDWSNLGMIYSVLTPLFTK